MSCCNNNKDELRIVKGNAFYLRVQVTARRMDGSVIEDFVLSDAEPVLRVLYGGTETETGMVVEGNEAVVYFNGNHGLGWYGLEMSGTWEGEAWRWCVEKVFQVVNTNAKANVPEWAFFLEDTYVVAGTFDLVAAAAAAVQSDWTETDPNSAAFILHKPDLSVYALKSEVSDVVRYSAQTLTDAQKRQVRTNIGAQERGNYVENLAGAASAYTTLIKAGNDSGNKAEVRIQERSVKLEAEAGSVEVSQNGVAVTAGNSGSPDARMTLNGKEVATKDDVSAAVSGKADKATTLAGYGITDAYTKQEVDDAIEAIDVSAQIAGKADKVAGAVTGDFAGLDANGNLVDSGKKASDFATAAQGTKADAAIPMPATGTTGQILKKTADGVEWADDAGGVTDYDDLTDKPQINSVVLSGNKSASDLGLAAAEDVAYLGEDDGQATIPNFDAEADTVWNKAQVLSSAQQQQARANIEAQETLVSGTNIKTINNESLLGSGNISISGGGGSGEANVIESISINGIPQTVTSKNVDLSVPTSSDVYSIVKMTEAAYALITPDANTLYILTSS